MVEFSDADLKIASLTVIVCGLAMYLHRRYDRYQEIELYYHRHNRGAYWAMKACTLLLLAALIFNSQYLIYYGIDVIKKRF